MGPPRASLAGAALAVTALALSAGIAAAVALHSADVLAAGAGGRSGGGAARMAAAAPLGAAARDARLSRIAGRLTGGAVRVDCVTRAELARRALRADAWGLAEREARRVSLLSPFCDFLAGVTGRRPAIPAYHAGPALLVFVHELEHIDGAASEGLAECRALRDLTRFTRAGFGVRDAAWLREAEAAAVRADAGTAPTYHAARC